MLVQMFKYTKRAGGEEGEVRGNRSNAPNPPSVNNLSGQSLGTQHILFNLEKMDFFFLNKGTSCCCKILNTFLAVQNSSIGDLVTH